VQTAAERFSECMSRFTSMDGAVLSAAVADFAPVKPSDSKIKREKQDNFQLNLQSTKDISASLGQIKKPEQVLVGFALETTDEMQNAQRKLQQKNLDFIVLNSLNDPGAGFQVDTNIVTIIDKHNNIEKSELKSKTEIAKDIVNKLVTILNHA